MEAHESPAQPLGVSAFRRSLERFRQEHIKGPTSELLQFTDLPDLKSAIKKIQDEQAIKNQTRNLGRLRNFLDGMEQYEKIIEVFLNSSEYLAFVWVSVLCSHYRAS